MSNKELIKILTELSEKSVDAISKIESQLQWISFIIERLKKKQDLPEKGIEIKEKMSARSAGGYEAVSNSEEKENASAENTTE